MTTKSSADRYGSVAASIHWVTALAVILMLASGQNMSLNDDLVGSILPIHVALGVLVGVLTLFRILWWVALDKHPAPQAGMSAAQTRLAQIVHVGLYLAVLAMVFTGIGMVALTGAAQQIFGGGPLPRFDDVPPFTGHSAISKVLLVLALGHIAAALWHHFIKRDGLIGRMRIGA